MTTGTRLERGELSYLDALDFAEQQLATMSIVICENYIVGMGTVRKAQGENWSLRSIGALEWMCHNTNTKFVLQKPADAKAFSTDEKLHEIGWWAPGKPHANDALRHLLLWLARNNHWDVAQALTLA